MQFNLFGVPMKLDQTTLRQHVAYDPITGLFSRVVPVRGRKVVGSLHGTGYIYIRVAGVRYRAHRLAYLYMTGDSPPFVDHINGDRADNRWSNLRPATAQTNAENRRKPKGNNPYIGVYWYKAKNKWAAGICVDKVRIHLGYFDTAEAARDAYLTRKRASHTGCTI